MSDDYEDDPRPAGNGGAAVAMSDRERADVRRSMTISNRGLDFPHLEAVFRYAQILAKAGIGNAEENTAKLIIGLELGIRSTTQALGGIWIDRQGKPNIYGDLKRELAVKDPSLAELHEWFEFNGERLEDPIPDPQTEWGENYKAVCEITTTDGRKSRGSFTIADAVLAGLWKGANKNKPDQSPWTKYPNDMLSARAFGRAQKRALPGALSGLPLAEDMDEPRETDAQVVNTTEWQPPGATDAEVEPLDEQEIAPEDVQPDPEDEPEPAVVVTSEEDGTREALFLSAAEKDLQRRLKTKRSLASLLMLGHANAPSPSAGLSPIDWAAGYAEALEVQGLAAVLQELDAGEDPTAKASLEAAVRLKAGELGLDKRDLFDTIWTKVMDRPRSQARVEDWRKALDVLESDRWRTLLGTPS